MANGGIIGPINEPTVEDLTTHFSSSGTFVAKKTQNVKLLVVAGGGGGGHRTQSNASGGGAGGFRLFPATPVTAGQSVTVTVGAGGTGISLNGQPYLTAQGDNSAFGNIASTGGGAGVGSGIIDGSPPNPNYPNTNVLDGGSGGGAATPGSNPAVGNGNAGGYSPSEGNNGGTTNANAAPGGGGGHAGAGQTPPGAAQAGAGGAGTSATPVFGSAPQSFYGPTNGVYSGGGGGGQHPTATPNGGAAGAGGSGGGGAGGSGNPSGPGVDAVDGTGGGGGGTGEQGAVGAQGGDGGNGVVLVKEASVVTASSGKWTLKEHYTQVRNSTWIATS